MWVSVCYIPAFLGDKGIATGAVSPCRIEAGIRFVVPPRDLNRAEVGRDGHLAAAKTRALLAILSRLMQALA